MSEEKRDKRDFDGLVNSVKEEKPKTYFIKYLEKGNVRITNVKGVSKIVPGKKYKVPKNIHDAYIRAANWETSVE